MKVIKVKNDTLFRAIGVKVLKTKDEYAFGIVNDNYNNGTEVYKGSRKLCEKFLANI